ncbi:MAG: YheC/YheD family protein [Limnochordia bacterium]|jgi:glutathione synthase/RimK-type ligase-like ATP-grasp enzyme
MYRVRLNTVKSPSACGLYLPARVLEGLQVVPGNHVEVQVGSRVARTVIGALPRTCISSDLKRRLRLPLGVLRLHVRRRGERLQLGPFLGILGRPQTSSPYGEQTAFFRRLIARAKVMHIYAYVFAPGDVSTNAATVMGHRPYKNSTSWVTRRCPVPDVVFDRGFFRGVDRVRAAKMRLKLVNEFGVKLFNTDIGSKWDVHQKLLAEEGLEAFLPETAVADSQSIRRLLDQYRVIYAKPVFGNQGRSVFRVRYRRNKVAYEAHLRRGKVVRASVPTTVELTEALKATGERCPFIAQQGLNLTRVQGRTTDLRALVQRDRSGAWRLTGVGVRIGGRSNVVSNLHAGGSAAKLDVLIPRPGRRAKVEELGKRIEDLVLKVAEVLGRHHLLGELGIDLGLDTDGRLWVIEVNLRPGRATFRRAGLMEAWRRSGRAPLEFALHLWEANEDADD